VPPEWPSCGTPQTQVLHLFGGSSTFLVHRTRIAELAVKGRLPTMHNFREMVETGGCCADDVIQ